MAQLTIVYWRDIPAQVIVRAGRRTAKRELEQRFQKAIDHAAMATNAHESDAYLSQWRRGEPLPCGDDIEVEADRAAARLAREYDRERIGRLVAGGGQEAP